MSEFRFEEDMVTTLTMRQLNELLDSARQETREQIAQEIEAQTDNVLTRTTSYGCTGGCTCCIAPTDFIAKWKAIAIARGQK